MVVHSRDHNNLLLDIKPSQKDAAELDIHGGPNGEPFKRAHRGKQAMFQVDMFRVVIHNIRGEFGESYSAEPS
jgi:hypothetical protein